MNNRLYKRVASLVVGSGGKGQLISDLRIEFRIDKTPDSEPNKGVIRIYALNRDFQAALTEEYKDVILNAGYEGNERVIFRGNITTASTFLKVPNVITEIVCADGEREINNATVNKTIAAGATTSQIVEQSVNVMAGVAKGFVGVNEKKAIRGRVVSGKAKDVLDKIANDSGAMWSIQDGVMTIVKTTDVLPGQAVVISQDTGLIGIPQATEKGVKVECRLNPYLKVNGPVKIDSQIRMDAKAGTKKPKVPGDGIYKVVKLAHIGDTRGEKWKSALVCSQT